MGALLDSTFLIAAERNQLPLSKLLKEASALTASRDLAISSISVMEMAHGEARADSQARATRRSLFLDSVVSALAVIPVTTEIARQAGLLDGNLQLRGQKLAYADILIGVTALTIGYSILTRNERHFDRIPGLRVVVHH